jgi:hypothetical protein
MKHLSRFAFWPLFLAVVFVPLAVFLVEATVTGETTRYFLGLPKIIDYFAVAKARVLFFTAATGLVMFAALKPSAHMLRALWPLFLLGMLAIAAAVASPFHRNIVLWGLPDLWDGTLLWLAYFIVAALAFVVAAQRANTLRILSLFFLVGFLPLFAIGIAQYFGYIFLEERWLQSALSSVSQVSYTLAFGENWITSTLYNPNIVGSYVALMAPIALGFALYAISSTEKKIAWLTFSALLFMGVGSQSRAGFVGTIAACSVLIALSIFQRAFTPKHALLVVVAILPAALLFLSPKQHIRDDFLFTGPKGWAENFTQNHRPVRAVRVEEQWFVLDQDACPIAIRPNASASQGWDVRDANKMPIPYSFQGTPDNGNITLLDAACSPLKIITFRNGDALFAQLQNGPQHLTVGFPAVGARIAFLGSLLKPREPEILFSAMSDHFASFRGFIWKRSLPLVKESPLLGHGFGTFPALFPQDDIAGKMITLGANVLVDKPHSLYLQIAVAAGLPALLVFLVWMGAMLIKATRQHLHNPNPNSALAWSFSLGLLGFLVAGVFNDANVAVAPLFFITAGACAAKILPRQ